MGYHLSANTTLFTIFTRISSQSHIPTSLQCGHNTSECWKRYCRWATGSARLDIEKEEIACLGRRGFKGTSGGFSTKRDERNVEELDEAHGALLCVLLSIIWVFVWVNQDVKEHLEGISLVCCRPPESLKTLYVSMSRDRKLFFFKPETDYEPSHW